MNDLQKIELVLEKLFLEKKSQVKKNILKLIQEIEVSLFIT